jgi:hypothetical protein
VALKDEVAIGQKIWMIRRGSQVDLYLPHRAPSNLPSVDVGRVLRAGTSTLLAESRM